MEILQVVSLSSEQLIDYVHNKAKSGEILTTYDRTLEKRYVYFCNEENIGKNANPYWVMIDEHFLYKKQLEMLFENMTLEEKIDFLIEKYIDKEIMKIKSI